MHAKPGPIRVWGGGVAEGLSGGRNPPQKNGKLPFLYAGISQFHHDKVEDIWQAGAFVFGGTITIKNLDCHPDFCF